MKKKQKSSSTAALKKVKQNKISKSKLEWGILIFLILLIPVAIRSNVFAYEFYYFKCEGKPLELAGRYYRIPGDEGYGIHPGSDYSNCSYTAPPGARRDPSTKVGAAIIKNTDRLKRLAAEYEIYVPNGYKISNINTFVQGDGLETTFSVTTNTHHKFNVREMKKDSDFSYTNLCSKPARENWSGTIIGRDNKGRDICKTNISKYIKAYIVGINVGKTAIMLQASNDSVDLLNTEATAIFSSMEPRSN